MKAVSNAQVRKLMAEMSEHGCIGMAALKAGMDRKTARKYVKAGKMPLGDGHGSRLEDARRPLPGALG